MTDDSKLPQAMLAAGAIVLEPHVKTSSDLFDLAGNVFNAMTSAKMVRRGRPPRDPDMISKALSDMRAGDSVTLVRKRYNLGGAAMKRLRAMMED